MECLTSDGEKGARAEKRDRAAGAEEPKEGHQPKAFGRASLADLWSALTLANLPCHHRFSSSGYGE